MNREEINVIADAGRAKLDYLTTYPARYFSRAMVAGGHLMTGTLLSVISAAWFYRESMGTAKLLGAFTFSAALILVVLVGGELFTGTHFVLGISLYERRAGFVETLRLWAVCFLGNFAGILILAAIVAGSGASGDLMEEYLAATVPGRLNCGASALVFKGMMCNFMVCTGVYGGMKLKSEAGKCLAIIPVITTFVLSGFEHSVANMATFSLYTFLVPDADVMGCVWNMVWVTLGNILGGAVLLGIPVWLSAQPSAE